MVALINHLLHFTYFTLLLCSVIGHYWLGDRNSEIVVVVAVSTFTWVSWWSQRNMLQIVGEV